MMYSLSPVWAHVSYADIAHGGTDPKVAANAELQRCVCGVVQNPELPSTFFISPALPATSISPLPMAAFFWQQCWSHEFWGENGATDHAFLGATMMVPISTLILWSESHERALINKYSGDNRHVIRTILPR